MKGYEAGFSVVKESFKIIGRHPKIIVPLFFVSAILASMTIFLNFAIDWEYVSVLAVLILCFLVVMIYSFLLLFSCSMVLEMILQIDSGEEASLGRAFSKSLFKNSWRMTPLVIIWAFVWFVLALVEVLVLFLLSLVTGRRSDRLSPSPYSASAAALTLAGGSSASYAETATRGFFELIQRSIRMVIFLILPAIIWEDLGFFKAIKKGLNIFKKSLAPFAMGYATTWAICFALMVPVFIMFMFSGLVDKSSDDFTYPYSGSIEATAGIFPDIVWYGVIVYIVFVWAVAIYLEQIFSALLYLWHMKWEKALEEARRQNKQLPTFEDIDPPSILDEVRDINFL